MSATPLYDLGPSVSLLLLAALLAFAPALWVWRRHSSAAPEARRMALCVLVLFLTFDLILVGAFTRLTDSGLGCPDWPGCYGKSNPLSAHAEISAAQAAMPTGPVTHKKAWIEMAHRYLASSVGALIVLMTVIAWRDRARHRKLGHDGHAQTQSVQWPGPWLPTFTLFWVIVQGLFGALTVTMKLFPAIVTLHLLGAYALVALLVVQVLQWQRVVHRAHPAPPEAAPATSTEPVYQPRHVAAIIAGLSILLLQAISGAWVSTNYAVLVCGEFPTCQGAWWPAMDFAAALEIWRPLGEHADGRNLSFQALTAIHVTHRLLALLTFLSLGALWFWLRGVGDLARPRRYLAVLLLLQFVTGLSNVVLDWPIAAAMLHTAGAGALVGVLVWMLALSMQARPVRIGGMDTPLSRAANGQGLAL